MRTTAILKASLLALPALAACGNHPAAYRASAPTTSPPAIVELLVYAPEPVPETTTTVAPTTTTTIPVTTTTVPTTTTTVAPVAVQRVEEARTVSLTPPARVETCSAALADVQAAGLTIPPGWTFSCPGSTYAHGSEHRGRTCADPCYSTPARSISVNPSLVPAGMLRYVIAHEASHAWDYELTGTSSEASADAGAARYGFPA